MMSASRTTKKPIARIVIVTGLLISLALVVVCFVDNRYNLLTVDQKGYRLFLKDNFALAAEEFQSLFWKGVSLYRGGNFEEAANAFSGMDNPEGALNHGNSLLMLGKYEAAIERYERALVLKPDWPPAITNLGIAKNRSKSLEKKGGEMTGGKLGADEYVFSNNPSKNSGEETATEGDVNEAEQRSIWLRQVQTKPADFLRTKFAYQFQMKDSLAAGTQIRESEPHTGQE